MAMKSVNVQFDDDLLARLDASEEVRELGRSEVLQKAAAEYLGRCCQGSKAGQAIAEQYRRAYEHEAGLGEEFAGWEEQGAWPSK
ncbi:MAG TPA: CopG family transcriptional regulator [Thermoanaerobaculia bacterium]|jgi:metal-responsive CopG/Arc/MetJ family transcriptional regulator|nr:CopG family transcriptional regulator [Thermoanaerobaculia bacterium]